MKLAAAVLLVAVSSIQLEAQPGSPIAAGARLRVRTADGRTLIGRVEAVTSIGLELSPDDQTTTLTLPLTSLTRVEISRGPRTRKASAWAGAKKGALFGAIPGAVLLALQHEQVGEKGVSASHAAALGAWSGGLFGGLFGALFGAAHPGEEWERVQPRGGRQTP